VGYRVLGGGGTGGGGAHGGSTSLEIFDAVGTLSANINSTETNATQAEANSFALIYRATETNATPTDAQTLRLLGNNETNLVQTETNNSAVTYRATETNPTQTETSLLTGSIKSAETNAVQTETNRSTLTYRATEANATPTHGQTLKVTFIATGTWVCPAGITSATVQCWGGGRGGLAGSAADGSIGRRTAFCTESRRCVKPSVITYATSC